MDNMKYVEAGTFDNLEESARRIANSETEEDRTNRVLRCIRGPQWDFLSTLVSLPDCTFKTNTEAYMTPIVHEIPPGPPPKPPKLHIVPNPDYDPPNQDALAA